ncbi:MAG: hypothetical protein D6698_12390 [Gammaproteobacteria bacterium]|nr:MAG: hypothetical protein D6698_12390 [Gammaproteobacteria bacterium]
MYYLCFYKFYFLVLMIKHPTMVCNVDVLRFEIEFSTTSKRVSTEIMGIRVSQQILGSIQIWR